MTPEHEELNEDSPRRRMAPADRRSMILERAAEFFANHGPAASTRALARDLNITQALLYRYFPSKEALVRAVYQERFANRWQPQWSELLRDRARPLAERLTAFFVAYINRLNAPDYRLWMRAALEGWSFARLYHNDLLEHVLTPIAREMWHEAGIADDGRPPNAGELEIVFNLHGSLMFLRIRRDIYGAPVLDATEEIVALHVRVFLPGGLEHMKVMHDSPPPALAGPPLVL